MIVHQYVSSKEIPNGKRNEMETASVPLEIIARIDGHFIIATITATAKEL
jgi:hypothetical protein